MNTAHNKQGKIINISGERMQTQLPEPLTPPDADLTGFEWAEFNSNRMQRSDLWLESTGDEFKAWFALWMYAQGEVPAGTLPNNERRMASIVASCGVFDWNAVKQMALHGWVLCSDNRYYHPVIAEAVSRAWSKRKEFNQIRENANDRKRQQREQREAMFAALRKIGIVPEFNTKMEALRSICKSNGIDISNLCHSDKPVTNVKCHSDNSVTNSKCHSDGHVIDLDLDLDLDLDNIIINTPQEFEGEQFDKESLPNASHPSTSAKSNSATKKPNTPAPTTPVWNAYVSAYLGRYGVEPIRAAKVNSQLSTLIKTVGQDKAISLPAIT